MPYFVRQPYVPTRTPRAMDGPSSENDILELAKDVLGLELGEGEKRPFRVRDPIQPGGCGSMVLELALDPGPPPRTINLVASDLVSASSRINSDWVRVAPPTLTLPAGGSVDIRVTVQAPAGAHSGLYAGTVWATGDETFTIPIQIEIR